MLSAFDAIADELAEHGYAVADQFLSQSEGRAIVSLNDFRQRAERFSKAAIGKHQARQVNEAIRGDYIRWIDKGNAPPEVSLYLDRVEGLMHYLNQTLFLSLKDFEIHMTVYPVGAFYKRHLDQFKKDDRRKVSVICYLNEEWKVEQGGQLRIYLPEGQLDILPIMGRLVCFRSDLLEHEVLPATRERLSLTGWLLNQYADL